MVNWYFVTGRDLWISDSVHCFVTMSVMAFDTHVLLEIISSPETGSSDHGPRLLMQTLTLNALFRPTSVW